MACLNVDDKFCDYLSENRTNTKSRTREILSNLLQKKALYIDKWIDTQEKHTIRAA